MVACGTGMGIAGIGMTIVELEGFTCSMKLAKPAGQATTGSLPCHSIDDEFVE